MHIKSPFSIRSPHIKSKFVSLFWRARFRNSETSDLILLRKIHSLYSGKLAKFKTLKVVFNYFYRNHELWHQLTAGPVFMYRAIKLACSRKYDFPNDQAGCLTWLLAICSIIHLFRSIVRYLITSRQNLCTAYHVWCVPPRTQYIHLLIGNRNDFSKLL